MAVAIGMLTVTYTTKEIHSRSNTNIYIEHVPQANPKEPWTGSRVSSKEEKCEEEEEEGYRWQATIEATTSCVHISNPRAILLVSRPCRLALGLVMDRNKTTHACG